MLEFIAILNIPLALFIASTAVNAVPVKDSQTSGESYINKSETNLGIDSPAGNEISNSGSSLNDACDHIIAHMIPKNPVLKDGLITADCEEN